MNECWCKGGVREGVQFEKQTAVIPVRTKPGKGNPVFNVATALDFGNYDLSDGNVHTSGDWVTSKLGPYPDFEHYLSMNS